MSDATGKTPSLRARSAAFADRLPFGMGTVAVLGSLALMIVAGVVLWGPQEQESFDGDRGQLRGYASAPTAAWTLDETDLPGYTAESGAAVEGFAGDLWLVSYPTGSSQQETAFLLIDAATGEALWDKPVDAGFGDCAITRGGQIGCAIDTADAEGFYLVDRGDGTARRTGELAGTTSVIAADRSFLRLDSVRNTVAMTRGDGRDVWSRTLSHAPNDASSAPYSLVYIETTAGTKSVLDPADGRTLIECASCEIAVYETGVVVAQEKTADTPEASISVYRQTRRGLSAEPVKRIEEELTLLPGPSTAPVVTTAGAQRVYSDNGDYWVIDLATGDARWRTPVDPEVSKVHAMPCGDLFALNTKSGDRTVYRLGDGSRIGVLPLGRGERRDENLDALQCVGSSNDLLVVADKNRITAFDAARGESAWYLDINGRVDVVNGYLVLRQGSELSKLAPN